MNKISEYMSQEEQEMFERFLFGQMDANETELFRTKLSDDPKLSENFELFKTMFRAIEEDGLRSKMEEFHAETEGEKTHITSLRYLQKYNYVIAASIALLVVVGSGYFFLTNNSNKAFYKKYYSVDPGLPTVMGKSSDYEFYKAMIDYKQGKYEDAIKIWESLLVQKTNNDTLNYFLGAAYLANDNKSKAVSFFDQVISNKESYFYNDSQFYLGLIALDQGELQKAKAHFELSKTDKSHEILEQLKN